MVKCTTKLYYQISLVSLQYFITMAQITFLTANI